MKTEFHYQNLVSGEVVRSQVELQINGLALMAIVEVDELSAEDEKARAMDDLPKLIGKQQKAATTDDPWQMWRYYNNAQVARLILDGQADHLLVEAFTAMLDENKLDDPKFYGGMTVSVFANFLLGLNQDFMLMGLRLEAERIRRRRELNSAGLV